MRNREVTSGGSYKQGYVSTLQERNPEKKQNDDWWGKMCEKYNETDITKKEEKKEEDNG